jgi:shikimate dehydrogenase
VFVVAVSGAGRPAIAALDPRVVRADALWMDLNYWDQSPPLFDALQRRGVELSDGLAMLIHQGALAFEAFTGVTADPEVARRVLGGGLGR